MNKYALVLSHNNKTSNLANEKTENQPDTKVETAWKAEHRNEVHVRHTFQYATVATFLTLKSERK